MFDWLKNLFSRVRRTAIPESTIEKTFGVTPAVSKTMEDNIALWYAMYTNRPPWESCDIRPLGLPGAIGRELARHAFTEFNMTVSGGARGDFLNEQIQRAKRGFKNELELGLCLGGIALRPMPDGNRILIDATTPAAFSPTEFDGTGRATAGVFRELARQGKEYYVRLEYHGFERTEDGEPVYVIRNRAFKSDKDGSIGPEARLTDVSGWADLQPETVIEGLSRPLFAYFKPPIGNDIEPASQAGVSVYGGATVELIRQADEQWERIWWEYKSGERKIIADDGVDNTQLDHRLFITGSFTPEGDLFEQFSPAFRDDPLYKGFQRILQRIEFNVGLSYGTISDPQAVEKTATEILAAKQRQYATEGDIQEAFQDVLEDLLYAMDVYCDLYRLAPAGGYEAVYNWGDGVLDDPETRRQDKAMDLQEVSAGIMQPWEYRMKWKGEDEETAKAALPGTEDLVSGS